MTAYRVVRAAGVLCVAVVVFAAPACAKDPDLIPDPATVDLGEIERRSALECVDLTLAHLDLVQAASPAEAEGPLAALREFDPPHEVLRALEYQARYAGATQRSGQQAGKHAYEIVVKWKAAACPPPADRGEGDFGTTLPTTPGSDAPGSDAPGSAAPGTVPG